MLICTALSEKVPDRIEVDLTKNVRKVLEEYDFDDPEIPSQTNQEESEDTEELDKDQVDRPKATPYASDVTTKEVTNEDQVSEI